MWNRWKHLGCVEHWILVVGMAKEVLIFLAACLVRKKRVHGTLRAHKGFQVFRLQLLIMFRKRVHMPDAQRFHWKWNKFVSLDEWPRIHIFQKIQKSIKDNIGDVYCPGRFCERRTCAHVQTWEWNGESCYEWVQGTTRCQASKFLFEDQRPTIELIAGDGTVCLAKNASPGYEAEK